MGKTLRKFIVCLLILLVCPTVIAREWQDNDAVAQLFAKYQLVGTFVVYDVQQDKLIGYNQIRANSRYIPTSTFKIVNSLIG